MWNAVVDTGNTYHNTLCKPVRNLRCQWDAIWTVHGKRWKCWIWRVASLPNCVHLHTVTRANYQAVTWHRALQADPEAPSSLKCKGWVLGDNRELIINWMSTLPTPDIVLEFLSCKCKKSCMLPSCQCIVSGLQYTQACFLQECENMKDEEITAEQDEGLDGSDTDSDSDSL